LFLTSGTRQSIQTNSFSQWIRCLDRIINYYIILRLNRLKTSDKDMFEYIHTLKNWIQKSIQKSIEKLDPEAQVSGTVSD